MKFDKMHSESYLFKDESKLFPEYVPNYLPHREEQLKKLNVYFKGLLDPEVFAFYRVICYGPTGTGKTALTKFFGKLMYEESAKRGINLKFIHINCHIERTPFMIITKIAESLIPGIPKRGFSPKQYLTWVMDFLEEENSKLLLCLDEADYAMRNDPEIFYDLSRIPETGISKVRISLIIILRDLSSLHYLSDSTISTLQKNMVYFEPYKYIEIKEILKERIKEAFLPNVVGEEIVEEIALKTGIDKGGRGDARFALELLWRAAKIAEMEGRGRISPNHLRKAISEVHPSLSSELLDSLLTEEKILLLSIGRALKEKNSIRVSINNVREHYLLLCESLGKKPKQYTQFWEYLRSLKNKGLIDVRVFNENRGRRSYISLSIPVEVLEKKSLDL